MAKRIIAQRILATVVLVLFGGLTPYSASRAYGNTITCSVTDVPIRLAIQVIWSSGAPEGTSYSIDDNVPTDTRVTLSLQNAPFETALDALCQAAGIQYQVNNQRYTFTRQAARVSSISIARMGDRVKWRLRDADPIDALVQLLDTFSKKFELNLDKDPGEDLEEQAKRYAQDLQQIANAAPIEQSNRMRELQKDAERYVKPPKSLPRGSKRSISAEDAQIPFPEAMDALGNAGGFMWFRGAEGKILIRNTTTVDNVRRIFQKENVWDALQK